MVVRLYGVIAAVDNDVPREIFWPIKEKLTEGYINLYVEKQHNFNFSLHIIRGSNPGDVRSSGPIQTISGAHPTSCTMGTGSFSE